MFLLNQRCQCPLIMARSGYLQRDYRRALADLSAAERRDAGMDRHPPGDGWHGGEGVGLSVIIPAYNEEARVGAMTNG
jgi:hypothetical protein